MSANILKQQVTSPNQALGWFLAITMGMVFAVGGAIAAFDMTLGSPAYNAMYAVGLLSPFIGSLVYAWFTTGSLAPIRRMYLPLRLGIGGLMIIAVPLSLVTAYLVGGWLGLPLDFGAAEPLSALFIAFLGWSSIMWAEETGWRGTLLPALQSRFSPLTATFWVCLAWIVWHIPLLYLIGMDLTGFGFFILQMIGLSAAMTWAYNRSGTVLVPVLVHGIGNATGGWLTSTIII